MPADEPSDIYQIVADKVNEKLKESDKTIAKQWLEFGVDRKCTKETYHGFTLWWYKV